MVMVDDSLEVVYCNGSLRLVGVACILRQPCIVFWTSLDLHIILTWRRRVLVVGRFQTGRWKPSEG